MEVITYHNFDSFFYVNVCIYCFCCKGRPWLNRHSSCSTNVFMLDNLIKIPILISTYEHLTKLYCAGRPSDLWIDQSKRSLPYSVSFCTTRCVSRYAVIFIVKFRKCRTGVVKHNNNSIDKTTIQSLVFIEA